ncbi:MAG: DHH family phosphoesterase [Candidatus Altimarinota bacterium]
MKNNHKDNLTATLDVSPEQAQAAWQAISQAENIVIISHRSPDPDAIGSNLALRLALTQSGKKILSACVDKIPTNAEFLAKALNYDCAINLDQADLLISVDCGSKSQVAFESIYPGIFQAKPFINIDHHASNDFYGTINLVYTQLSSTCEIVYKLFKLWNIQLTPAISTCLLFGLYYDTGSFMHSNTSESVLKMAEDLLQNGADQQIIIENLYKNYSESKFKIWGKVLDSMKITNQNAVSAALSNQEIQDLKVDPEDLSGIINYLSMVKGSDYAVFVHEDKPGQIKGSLRTTQDKLDLSALAAQLNGGGHKKASGFTIPGQLDQQEIWEIRQ